MKAIGMICGVGSMLIGAKKQGFEIIGNIEWRKYYHTGTFELNFPGAFMVNTLQDLTPEQKAKCDNLDLLIGHTECGNFSNLRADKNKAIDAEDKGDIPQFVEAVQQLSPKFFIMDNLPKSLLLADWAYYNELLPNYDIHFEWVNNYGYGNVQKNRKRLFVIGSKKELGFYFIPGEFEHNTSVLQRVSEIDSMAENRDSLELDAIYGGWARYQFDASYIGKTVDENRMTLREFQDRIKDYPNNLNFPYYNKKGEQKFKIGFSKINVDGPAMVLSGGGACFDNHFRSDTLYPFTIRERAKIQGCPDDFVFLPTGITTTGKEYGSLIKQTGKFMPVEFCTYITEQIMDFLKGNYWDDEEDLGKRYLNPNQHIDFNKWNYCEEVGYTNQAKVCQFCGSKKNCKSLVKMNPNENKIAKETEEDLM